MRWIKSFKAHPDTELPITLALRVEAHKIQRLEKALWDVSDPELPTYANFWNNDDITQAVGMDNATIENVVHFLSSNNMSNIHLSRNRDYLHATGTVQQLELMLKAEFYHFRHPWGDVEYIRSGQALTIPAFLDGYVDFIAHVDNFPSIKSIHGDLSHKAEGGSGLGTGNSPVVLVPTTWRGSNLLVMAVIRCHDGSFRRINATCGAKVRQLLVTVDPVPEKLPATVKAFKPFALFDAPRPYCRTCYSFSSDHYTRGQLTRDLCVTMLKQLQAPNNTLFCRLEVEGAELGTPSNVNVATVYETSKEQFNAVSHESECIQGLSLQNCSKIVRLMPDVTPQFLREMYGIPNGTVGSNSRNIQAVAAFLNEHYSEHDLASFYKGFGVSPTHRVSRIIGPNNPLLPTGEASLDVQTIMGIAPNVSTWFWSVGGLRENALPASEANQEVRMMFSIEL